MKIGEEIKQKKFESNFHMAHLNLIFTSNWFQERTKSIMKKYDITQQQYNVLRILKGKKSESCSAGEIKEVMLTKVQI